MDDLSGQQEDPASRAGGANPWQLTSSPQDQTAWPSRIGYRKALVRDIGILSLAIVVTALGNYGWMAALGYDFPLYILSVPTKIGIVGAACLIGYLQRGARFQHLLLVGVICWALNFPNVLLLHFPFDAWFWHLVYLLPLLCLGGFFALLITGDEETRGLRRYRGKDAS